MLKNCHTEVDGVVGPKEQAGQDEVGDGWHLEDVEEGLLQPEVDKHGNLEVGQAQRYCHCRQLQVDEHIHTMGQTSKQRLGGGESWPENPSSQGGGH